MSEKTIITMLYPVNIKNIWPEMENMVSDVLAMENTHTTDDVHKSLLSGQAHLWVQWTKDVEAFMVTEFVNYPKGAWLRIWLMSAKPDKEILWDKIQDEITKFAVANKCAGIEIIGRKGWEKIYKQAEKYSVVLRLSLTDSNRIH